jgi:hypothetical protein
VKELDFSLPSYEDIKSSKASAENSKSLTIQPKPFDPMSISLRTTSPAAATITNTNSIPSDEGEDAAVNNPLSSLLPSMSKKGPKPKKSYDGYTF